ncbi:MAG: hypothetical protein MJA30_23260, partial [Cytophagales bacterium]|nr:hypothetical protein [Cytophagales bacterium]
MSTDYQKSLSELDFDTAIQFFTEDAEGGNISFGIFPNKRQGIRDFMNHNPDDHGYECVWRVVDGDMVRWKWRHWLRGKKQ